MSGVFIRRHFDGSVSDDARQGFSIHAELRTIASIGQRAPFCHRFCNLQEAISKTLLSRKALRVGFPNELVSRVSLVCVDLAADNSALLV